MPLDGPGDGRVGLARQLIGRRRYAQAIEVLREEVQGRAPSARKRLQFADVLVRAGRGREALPVLTALADEYAAEGFVAKAIAVLKRVERIEPGRDDVAARLSLLVERQQRLAGAAAGRPAPEFGMEEFGDDPTPEPEVPPEDPGPAVAEPPADSGLADRMKSVVRQIIAPGSAPAEGAEPAATADTPPDHPPDEAARFEPLAAESPAPEVAAPGPVAKPGLAGRFRGAFRRLLASFSTAPAPPAPDADAEPAPMSEAAFGERLLDIVEEMAQAPASVGTAAGEARAAWEERLQALDHARRLLASPLFAELSEEELLAVVRGLSLLVYEPGDVVLTEGQPGQGLFVLTAGSVRVFVRNPAGHDVEVGTLQEGDFFGEISSLSGRPRTATVTAATRCELLELDKATVDAIALKHQRVRDMLDAAYVARVSSPEAIAARAVAWAEGTTRARALDVLQEHFGQTDWTPRTRLRLADALFKAGRQEEVVALLLDCVDELTRQGFPEKAVALLKKVERVQRRDVEEVNLAPLLRVEADAPAAAPAAPSPARPAPAEDHFEDWLLAMARQAAGGRGPAPIAAEGADAAATAGARAAGYLGGLRASPLFESLGQDELKAVVAALVLVRCAPGHVILTEGEPGQSVFVLASGRVRVFVRDVHGHNVEVARLAEGAFFGEVATLSNRPRSATVVAATPCELLELDRAALDGICAQHPQVRETLEEFYIARAASEESAAARRRGSG